MSSPDDLTGLFEARRKVFPKAVDGSFRRLKWLIMAATLTIYYVTPWLRWDRGPYAPDQAVLVDLAHRRFYMFAIEIWPHEFYYVTGLLVMAAIGLFLVTSVVGRAWCGYACPQTVWTDLFVHVERLLDGDRNAQDRLERAPWTAGKILRRVSKHAAWIGIGIVTGGAWVFYFTDAPALAHQLLTGTAPTVAYATIGILTATTYVFGGLLREQVCIYMCPWPRIQGAMMDERSLAVTYKSWRGEPRSRGLKRHGEDKGPITIPARAGDPISIEPMGDCIDCNACVAVCPTGVDIRNGPQIGCITCGLCIDACDAVMAKIGRPPKLIGYAAEEDARLAREGKPAVPPLRRMMRPRSLVYLAAWSAVGLAMLTALGARTHIGISVTQQRNPLWVRLSDGTIRNSYIVKVRNMQARPREVEIAISGMDAVLWADNGSRERAGRTLKLRVDADQVARQSVFVAGAGTGPQRSDLRFSVRALDFQGEHATDDIQFERPEAGL